MSERIHQLVDRALTLPGLLHIQQRRFDAAFSQGKYSGYCRGVFKTHEEAARSAPATLPLGYDHEGPASMYRDRLERVWPSDYAMMLWLKRTFEQGARRVFDLGGHVGVGYYAYQKYLEFPQDLDWQICDVPAVADQGRKLAAEMDHRHALHFADSFEPASQADVLFTSGCLQYLPESLADKVATLASKPTWILVNLLPLHESEEYWTVQSIGQAFCPYHIQRKATFFADLQRLGYDLLDVWENAEKSCTVMFSPQHSLRGYFGAALKRKDSSTLN